MAFWEELRIRTDAAQIDVDLGGEWWEREAIIHLVKIVSNMAYTQGYNEGAADERIASGGDVGGSPLCSIAYPMPE